MLLQYLVTSTPSSDRNINIVSSEVLPDEIATRPGDGGTDDANEGQLAVTL